LLKHHISENTTVECRACSFVFVLCDYLYCYWQTTITKFSRAVVWDYKYNCNCFIFARAGPCMFSTTEVSGGADC